MVVYVTSVKEDRCLFSIFKEIGYGNGDCEGMKNFAVAGSQVFVSASGGGDGDRRGADLSAGEAVSEVVPCVTRDIGGDLEAIH